MARNKSVLTDTREVYCPRCYQQCGWCSDYRHMHGTLKLPGSRRKCKVPDMDPEGDNCPVCRGAMRVMRTTTYAPIVDKGSGR